MSGFGLHAVTVGEGILALCPLPGQAGNYGEDLETLRQWKPALLISLTSDVELLAAGAASLGADIQAAGCRWEHLPIVDFGVPDKIFLDQWPRVSQMARSALAGGGRVVVHCKGGCGRSGMVLLRLMVQSGQTADEALQHLRQARACAIETEAQMVWARTGRLPKS